MTQEPVTITTEKLMENMDVINSILERNSLVKIAEIEYEQVTPSMIGDFTGEHYKLYGQPQSKDKYSGVYLTGIPNSQQIIGKARWLMRVAIAHALGLKTHKEAEEALNITIERGSKKLKLGAVQLFYGTTSNGKQWKALLTVHVFHLLEKMYWDLQINEKESSFIPIETYIEKARSYIVDTIFTKNGVYWRVNKKGNYSLNSEAMGSRNRYNSLLAMGAYVSEYGNVMIPRQKVGKKKEVLALVDPIKKGLIHFKLELMIDKKRWSSIKIKLSEAGYDPDALLNLAVLSILSVPVLMGVGKGSNRGFGRFKITNIDHLGASINNSIDVNSLNDPFYLIDTMYRSAKDAIKYSREKYSKLKTELVEIKIPRLPVGEFEKYRSFIDKDYNDINDLLGLIGAAASKASWKILCYSHIKRDRRDILKSSGRYFHTWLLGLPRNNKKQTGYLLKVKQDDEEKYDEGRRQSFTMAFTLGDNSIYAIAFPSGDLFSDILDNLVLMNNKKPETRVINLINKSCSLHEKKIVNIKGFEALIYEIYRNYFESLNKIDNYFYKRGVRK